MDLYTYNRNDYTFPTIRLQDIPLYTSLYIRLLFSLRQSWLVLQMYTTEASNEAIWSNYLELKWYKHNYARECQYL